MLKTVLLVCLIALAAFGAWRFDSSGSTARVLPAVQPTGSPAPTARAGKPTTTAAKTARPTPTMPEGAPAPAALRNQVATITSGVSKVGGLHLKHPVVVRFISRKDFARRYRMELDRE